MWIFKTMDRKTMLLHADICGVRPWFKWYHTNGFIRFQLLQTMKMRGRFQYLEYLFWGYSARSVVEKHPPLGHDIIWPRR